MEENVNLKKYILIFSALYILLIFLSSLFKINISSTFISMILAIFVAELFVKNTNRPPNKYEKHKLVLFSMLCIFIIDIMSIIVYIYLLNDPYHYLQRINTKRLNNLMPNVFLLFVQVLVFYFAYEFMARKFFRGYIKTKK